MLIHTRTSHSQPSESDGSISEMTLQTSLQWNHLRDRAVPLASSVVRQTTNNFVNFTQRVGFVYLFHGAEIFLVLFLKFLFST